MLWNPSLAMRFRRGKVPIITFGTSLVFNLSVCICVHLLQCTFLLTSILAAHMVMWVMSDRGGPLFELIRLSTYSLALKGFRALSGWCKDLASTPIPSSMLKVNDFLSNFIWFRNSAFTVLFGTRRWKFAVKTLVGLLKYLAALIPIRCPRLSPERSQWSDSEWLFPKVDICNTGHWRERRRQLWFWHPRRH